MKPKHKTGQNSECDIARTVVICGPSFGKMMGALHPAGSLYERPTNIIKIEQEFREFRRVLESHNVQVFDVRDVLMMNCSSSVSARVKLEDLAMKCLVYTVDPTSCQNIQLDAKTMHYVGEEYKRTVVEEMSDGQLVSIVMTNPTVTLKQSYRDTGFTASYSFEPLSNITFTRDQQITTRKGIVMGRLRSEQRRREVDVLEFCHEKLGLNVIGRIPAPGYLEGGDFFPAGEDLCFVGIGPRSNFAAVEYMMENDLLGTRRVAVVRDEYEKIQDRMHLDTVFNILDTDCCIMLDEMMGMESPTRREVDEYSRPPDGGRYTLSRQGIELSQYVREQGYHIIPISGKDQLEYGCNVLNLGDGHIISVHRKTAREISRSSHFRGEITLVDFKSVTAMYGAVHCASQVVYRGEPEEESQSVTASISEISRAFGENPFLANGSTFNNRGDNYGGVPNGSGSQTYGGSGQNERGKSFKVGSLI
eukprot:CAMPEP_0184691852 /NCGR_PEP_ID=MMETSP0313-20130426/568_1 /TAXON_ID=2792 /ORGANISM="Porphyridium aerugineum, Strain SAG 1380-2" /LENGTH=475 /DNA_ID=CAMNT_0027149621 /DNA_START=101 /DNA_END=1528 /DNA_ORIENTATION=-